MRYTVILVAVLASACSTSTDQGGSKLSDAQITYFAHGQNMLLSDSAAFNPYRMEAVYSRSDSLFALFANCWYEYGMISFVFRAPLDTGTTNLDQSMIPFSNIDPYRSVPPGLDGNAMVYFSDGAWSTDSIHIGKINITEVDTVNHTLNATFSFIAIDTTKGNSDTLHIDNGVISKMRFQIN